MTSRRYLLAAASLLLAGCSQTNVQVDVIAAPEVVDLVHTHSFLHITPAVVDANLGPDPLQLGYTLACATDGGEVLVRECVQAEGSGSECFNWAPAQGPVHSFGTLATGSGFECAELQARAEAWSFSTTKSCGDDDVELFEAEPGALVAATAFVALGEDDQACFPSVVGVIPQPEDQPWFTIALEGEHILEAEPSE